MNSKKFSFSFDHAIALVSKDLWDDDASLDIKRREAVAGLAVIAGVCGDNRYSISEEFGGFQNTGVMAHEIAHK